MSNNRKVLTDNLMLRKQNKALGSLVDTLFGGIGGGAYLLNLREDLTPELGAELDALTNKIVNLGDAEDLKDAVNLDTLMNETGLGLHYFLQGSNILSQTLIESESSDTETIDASPDTMTNLFYKSTVVDTPAPFDIPANTIMVFHTSMNVDAVAGHKTFTAKFQMGYVDADGTSNFVQIGADSDDTATLTASKTEYVLHLHIASETIVPSGKRLWVKVIATVVNDTSPNYPDLTIYRDSEDHHVNWSVSGSILNNYILQAENIIDLDITPSNGFAEGSLFGKMYFAINTDTNANVDCSGVVKKAGNYDVYMMYQNKGNSGQIDGSISFVQKVHDAALAAFDGTNTKNLTNTASGDLVIEKIKDSWVISSDESYIGIRWAKTDSHGGGDFHYIYKVFMVPEDTWA